MAFGTRSWHLVRTMVGILKPRKRVNGPIADVTDAITATFAVQNTATVMLVLYWCWGNLLCGAK